MILISVFINGVKVTRGAAPAPMFTSAGIAAKTSSIHP
jgi:hypothetical protein